MRRAYLPLLLTNGAYFAGKAAQSSASLVSSIVNISFSAAFFFLGCWEMK